MTEMVRFSKINMKDVDFYRICYKRVLNWGKSVTTTERQTEANLHQKTQIHSFTEFIGPVT